MKQQKILIYLSLFLSLFLFHLQTYAVEIRVITDSNQQTEEVSREEIFNYLSDFISDDIPDSYKYIKLNFKGVPENTPLYDSLQKLVYLDLVQNTESYIGKSKKLNVYGFLRLAEKVIGVNIITESEIPSLKKRNTTQSDLNKLDGYLNRELNNFQKVGKNSELIRKKRIFVDVYSTLLNNHLEKDDITEEQVIEGAIEGATKSLGDKHTVFFPAIETETFYENLNGEYEGIGAYVDMEQPGAVRIVSPVTDSPAQKAGLKGGDLIIAVDGIDIRKENPLQEVVSWIKGPAGSTVTLTIKRGESVFDVDVIRGKITIKDVEYEMLDSKTFYIQIKSFGDHVSADFKEALEELKERKNAKKVIIDLRNNGGGYLGQVADMLSYFINEGEPTAFVKYRNGSKTYSSKGYDLIDFSKYRIILLQNSGTASASEIMIGTIKDYYPNAHIVGENSYGKGSVQTVKQYTDGSSLKYTIAKWFTGKSQTGIDGVGIKPTTEVELDIERYKKYDIDNQLEKAKTVR